MINTILNDRYKILRQIGSGGMSIVYKALDMQTSEVVAIKVLRPELAEDVQLLKRFNQEATAASALSHPNIVKMRDVGCDSQTHYIVMDLIEGITLKEYIEQNKPLAPQEAAKIALDIAKGLQHAHSNGVIHRDIKPHNIIIDKDNVVKITDFGIARIVSDATRTTQCGKDMMGTVYYTSPEQVRGYNVDARTDIYSLGVVLYEMVTGSVPFDGETAVSIAMQHVTKEPEAVKKINKDVPVALDNIIKNAMAKRIENRYKTIDDMIRDLKKYISNYESEIKLLSTPSVVRKNKIVLKQPTEKQKKQRKKELNSLLINMVLVIILATLFAVLVYGIYNIGLSIYENNFVLSQVQTPSVVGQTADEAKSVLQDKQLVYREISTRYSSTVPKGCIIEQTPAAGETVNEDTLVDVVISLGAFIIDIPDFKGMNIVSAEYELRSNPYITIGKYNYIEDAADEGTIIGQSIEPGKFSLDGNYVTIYFDISTGTQKTTVEMKDFVGYAYSSLEQLASVYNITIGKITYEYSDTIGKDIVMRQSIPKGTEIEKNTTVDFVISLGPLVVAEKTITINVPSSITVSDNDTVYLRIKYIDNNQFADAINERVEVVDSVITVKLKGTGTVNYYIYINDRFIESRVVKFN